MVRHPACTDLSSWPTNASLVSQDPSGFPSGIAKGRWSWSVAASPNQPSQRSRNSERSARFTSVIGRASWSVPITGRKTIWVYFAQAAVGSVEGPPLGVLCQNATSYQANWSFAVGPSDHRGCAACGRCRSGFVARVRAGAAGCSGLCPDGRAGPRASPDDCRCHGRCCRPGPFAPGSGFATSRGTVGDPAAVDYRSGPRRPCGRGRPVRCPGGP